MQKTDVQSMLDRIAKLPWNEHPRKLKQLVRVLESERDQRDIWIEVLEERIKSREATQCATS